MLSGVLFFLEIMSLNISNLLIRICVPVAIICAMGYFRKWFPARISTQHGRPTTDEELEDRFMPLRGRIIGGMIAIMIIFFVVSWLALSGANKLIPAAHGSATILYLPTFVIWTFFPFFGCLSLSWELTLQAMRLLRGREETDVFSDWTNRTTAFWGKGSWPGIDSRRVLRWMSLLITLPIGVLTVLALNMHAEVGPNSIRDCGYAFKSCLVYPLGDARRMTAVTGFRDRDGKIVRRPGIVVDFKDGRRWSSTSWNDSSKAVDTGLANFLIGKTGLPLDSIEAEDDLLPLTPGTQTH